MKAKFLKIFVPAAGVLACAMRIALYATGFDGRGLLIEKHWARIGLLALTGLVAVVLLVLGLSIKGGDKHRDFRPEPITSAIGCFAAAAGLAVTAVREFGELSSVLRIAQWALGLGSILCFAILGICRWQRSRSHFALHAVICFYLGLRTVALYRTYSFDPMVQDYTFYLMACVALLVCNYHHMAFEVGMGKHRWLWITSLAAVYLCLAALKNCPDTLMLTGCAIYALTNLTDLTVRRSHPRMQPEKEEEAQ